MVEITRLNKALYLTPETFYNIQKTVGDKVAEVLRQNFAAGTIRGMVVMANVPCLRLGESYILVIFEAEIEGEQLKGCNIDITMDQVVAFQEITDYILDQYNKIKKGKHYESIADQHSEAETATK